MTFASFGRFLPVRTGLRACFQVFSARRVNITKLSDQITKLSDQITKLSDNVTKLIDNITKLSDHITKLSDNITKLWSEKG